jgi:CRISPR-associated protein (TIGR03986 family)
MRKGTLKYDGKAWKLTLELGKTMTVSGYIIPKELDGAVVEYDNTGGPIKTILHDGVELKKMGRPQPAPIPLARAERRPEPTENFATAPYNFIPLPTTIVPAPKVNVDFSSFQDGLLSGYIDLSIEAKTDLFIRGEMEKFFSVKNRPTIPGSSMRGLIRSLVEIVSFSKMSFTEKNRRYFYRNISDDYYKKQFLRTNPPPIKIKSKGAYLVKKGRKYLLFPVNIVYRVDMNRHPAFQNRLNRCYDKTVIWYDPKKYQKIRMKGNLQLEYNLLSEISVNPRNGMQQGVLLRTGDFGRTKHYQWVFPEFSEGDFHDVTKILEVYETDENRDPSANLIELAKQGNPIPCFYLEGEGNTPEYIGHTGVFRIPYQKTVGDFIHNQTISDFDISESIFGFITQDGKKQQSGRVFFEDSMCTTVNPKLSFGPLKILSSPKPTSWHLYLNQDNGRIVHWDTDNGIIRGQKMYWHRVGVGWKNEDHTLEQKSRQRLIQDALIDRKTQYTVAEVVQKDAVFSGRIRFDNLHPIELGALLSALKLPDECAHKIGMGKPFGMGSIRIKPKLTIINRMNRYKNIFNTFSDGCTRISTGFEEGDISYYINLFAGYLCDMIGNTSVTNKDWGYVFKNNERLKELYVMLLLEPQGNNRNSWEESTRYMQISRTEADGRRTNEFKTRRNLRRPSSHL